jgi:hypothetical protein
MVQEKNNYCLCSVLSDIFLDYNIKISQDCIAQNLTSTKKGFRTDDDKIKNFMGKNSFHYDFYWWNQTPFNEPDSLLREISEHQGFVGIEEHVFRVLEFEDPYVLLLDPANEIPRQVNYFSLLEQLRKNDGGFGLIKHIH